MSELKQNLQDKITYLTGQLEVFQAALAAEESNGSPVVQHVNGVYKEAPNDTTEDGAIDWSAGPADVIVGIIANAGDAGIRGTDIKKALMDAVGKGLFPKHSDNLVYSHVGPLQKQGLIQKKADQSWVVVHSKLAKRR